MIIVLEVILICASLLLAIPVAVIATQVVASLTPRKIALIPAGARPRVAVLVPAHNEAAVVGRTLDSIRGQLAAGDRLVVIADNCSDATEDAARRHGAEVSVRRNLVLRGKGYALAHGLDYLEQTGAPGIVIFIDADCEVRSGGIDRLALASFHGRCPAQGVYMMNPPRMAPKTALLVAFAWMVRDFVRPLGWHMLDLPCMLAGSGMAFPWPLIRSVNLAGSDLAEDMKLGLDLALAGHYALFVPDAVVTSDVAPAGVPSAAQRARWEHGTMEMLARYLPRLLVRLARAPSLPLLAVTLDLCVPPLALVALGLGMVLVLAVILFLLSGAAAPVAVSVLLCTAFFLAILLAWSRHARAILPVRWLVFAPFYAIRKVPLYARFLFDRQRAWVRGERA